jgi:DNA helicase-2/ATP-dependent DNA helicase PcrA
LALRIATILLRTDTAPDSILALTFTESGVHSMRSRLIDTIGQPAYKVNIYTFHGFCNDIIQLYPEEFPRIVGSKPATDIDQIQILEKIISEEELEYLRPYGDTYYYLRPALSTIRTLKRENTSPEDFKKLIAKDEKSFSEITDLYHEKGAHKGKMKSAYADKEKRMRKNAELCRLYERYEMALAEKKLYDFEDMIREVVKAFGSNNDLLLRMQEKYQYILADEHQDANAGQNKLLELLSNFHDSPNLFIVGDEKQAVFRFQGASLDNFLYFKKLYPHAEVISLEHNYRSVQAILDASHSLILNNSSADPSLRKKLMAKAVHELPEDSKPIKLYEFGSPDDELHFIAADIKSKLNAGAKPSDFAIIYRENRDANPLMRCLERYSIPFTTFSDQNLLEDDSIRSFLLLVRAIERYGAAEIVAQALYIDFLNIPVLDAFKLTHYSFKQRKNIFDVIGSVTELSSAGIADPSHIVSFSKKLSTWCTIVKNKGLVEGLETIIRESGFLSHILSLPDSVEKLAKLDVLFIEVKALAEARPQAAVSDFLKFLDAVEEYKILLKTGVVGADRDSVRLMTAHKSKGLEFDHVYIIGATDGHWGNKREMKSFHLPRLSKSEEGESDEKTLDPIEDERRLFYVALTRARHDVSITYARGDMNGKAKLPAQFIAEIDPSLVHKADISDFEKGHQSRPLMLYAPKTSVHLDIADREFFRSVFLSQGWSVTALNNYLRCPWEYFFTNLIRIPVAETKHQLYGTAVHAALKEFFTALADTSKARPSKEKMLESFERALRRQPLSPADFSASLKKGIDALGGYYEAYAAEWQRNILTELSISGVTLDCDLGGETKKIGLRGTLDKVEILKGDEVNVVDYKTAQPKTRNAILGATKDATSPDYFRQLTFYKILLDGYNNKQYTMVSAEIDFIEPDGKGKYHKELFTIEDDKVSALIETIQKASEEVYSGSFWEKECDEDDCRFCELRRMILSRKAA